MGKGTCRKSIKRGWDRNRKEDVWTLILTAPIHCRGSTDFKHVLELFLSFPSTASIARSFPPIQHAPLRNQPINWTARAVPSATSPSASLRLDL
ncbi:hypothetical protein QQF64_010680 [Cirrhinus molitorella]|uniref:Uncharacterized protein n=1 Tax=Cirrhinus molitorella TaxID=172907 RepID=A0ABR3LX30_9TELE